MSKNLNIHAENVTEEIYDILGVRPSGAQGDKVAENIRGANIALIANLSALR